MKKLFIIGCLAIAAMTASAHSFSSADDDEHLINVDSIMVDLDKTYSQFHRLTPHYLGNYFTNDWGSNWFVGAQGGLSFFLGNPKGCGDMFDRKSLTYGAYLGKWHNPYIGTRIAYQGGKFKDMMMEKQGYHALHADFMYNVTNHLLADDQILRRWDVIPYLGLGLIHGPYHYHVDCPCDACNGHNNAFVMAYGVQGRYRVTDRLHVTAELGGMSTFDDFDNHGSRHSFGDNLLSLHVGLSYTIGKNGWKRPVDARPYMAQNDYLLNNFQRINDANDALFNQHLMDASTLDRLRAVLEGEGLWDQYKYLFDDKARDKRNYYKGILSLRSRLMDAEQPKITHRQRLFEGKDSLLNAPVYFFFKLGTAILTDKSQLVNLDEIARIAKDHDLILRIDGAADIETGSPELNKELSRKRCQFMYLELKRRGIAADHLKAYWHGGVDEHARNEEDRNSKISVYLE